MGKWSALKEQFPAFQPPPDDDRWKRVQRKVQEFKEMDRKLVQERFKALRAEKERLENDLYDLNIELDAGEFVLLEVMEDEQVSMIRDKDGWGFGEEPRPYATIVDHAAFNEWAEKSGWRDMYTINHNTLNGNVKKLLESNEPLPPGVAVFIKNKIKLYRPR